MNSMKLVCLAGTLFLFSFPGWTGTFIETFNEDDLMGTFEIGKLTDIHLCESACECICCRSDLPVATRTA